MAEVEKEEVLEDQGNADESQVAEPTETELAAIEDLSDDELEKLRNAEPVQEEKADETDESADAPKEEGEADTKPSEEVKSEDEPVKEELKEGETTEDEMMNVSKAEWDKMQAHAKEQAEYEQRRGTEIGDLRAKLRDKDAQLLKVMPAADEFTSAQKEKLEELAVTDMLAWRQEITKIESENKAIRETAVRESNDRESAQQLAILDKATPTWRDSQEAVKAYLDSSGYMKPDISAQFSKDPSQFRDGGLLYVVAKDAAGNESLRARVKELELKLEAQQANIAKAASKSSTMANVGTTVKDAEVEDQPSHDDVENMSDAELAKLQPK